MKLSDALLRQKELREKLVQLERERYKPVDSLVIKDIRSHMNPSDEYLYYLGLHVDISRVINQVNLNTNIDIDERVFIDYSSDIDY